MKLFSDCSGPCCLCTYGGHGCLAGHGDNDFVYASKEELTKKLNENIYKDENNVKIIRERLLSKYNYNYEIQQYGGIFINKKVTSRQ